MDDQPNNEAATEIVPSVRCVTCKQNIGDYAGMCITCIDRKHVRLRGSMDLLYTRGSDRPTCQMQCGCGGKHDCFIRLGHDKGHKYSSECGENHNGR